MKVMTLAALACAAAAGAAPRPHADGLASVRAAYVTAWRAGDGEAVARFYAEDATYIGTAGDVVTGRALIAQGLRREVPAFRDFTIAPVESRTAKNMAWERGSYTATVTIPGRPPQPVTGPYVLIFERKGTSPWRIRLQMSGRIR